MAAFVFRKAPEALPEVKFLDAAGKERTLADWRGKVVLLNLWATWCLPCRKEMPALDRLQREMGSDTVRGGGGERRPHRAGRRPEVPRRDQAETLALYADPTARAGHRRCAPPACRPPSCSTAKAARSAACSAPPNGTARTPSA